MFRETASLVLAAMLLLFTAGAHAATTLSAPYGVRHNGGNEQTSGHGEWSTNEETGNMYAWLYGDSPDDGTDESFANQHLGDTFDAVGGQAYTVEVEGDFRVEMGTVGTAGTEFWLSLETHNEDTDEESSWSIRKLDDANETYDDDYDKSFTWEPNQGGEFKVYVKTWARAIAYGDVGSASVDYKYDDGHHYVDCIKISEDAGADYTNRWGSAILGDLAVSPGIEAVSYQAYQLSFVLKSVNGFTDTIAIDVEEECDWLSVSSTLDQVTLGPGEERTVELLAEIGDSPSSFWVAPVSIQTTSSTDLEPRESSFFIQGGVIPEPSTLVLLCMGAVGLAVYALRKRL